MRCRLRVGKAMRIGREHGRRDVINGTVRGGTDHRVDLWLMDGTILSIWPDGSSEMSLMRWTQPPDLLLRRLGRPH